MAGHVLDTGASHVETQCVHLLGVPLVPLKSYLVIEEESGASVELDGLHKASVVAAIGRTWGPLLVLAGVAGLAMIAGWEVMNASYIVAGIAATVVGWWAGHIPVAERARYYLYKKHTRHAVDPQYLALAERESLREDLRESVVDAAVVYAGRGYREAGASPSNQWETVLTGPEVTDPDLVARAMTLARLEMSLATDAAAKAHFRAAHDALWAKLAGLDGVPKLRVEAPREDE